MKTTDQKSSFFITVINWIKLHVTATIIGVILTGITVSLSIYAAVTQTTATEKSITRALVAYEKLRVPTIPDEIIASNPMAKNLLLETELIKGNLKQLEELKNDIYVMRKTKDKDLNVLAKPVAKQLDVQKVFQKVLSTFMVLLEAKDDEGKNFLKPGDGIDVEKLRTFLSLATTVSLKTAEANNELSAILLDMNSNKISKEQARKRLTKYLKKYYSDPIMEEYFDYMGQILIDFQKISIEKLEYYRLMLI